MNATNFSLSRSEPPNRKTVRRNLAQLYSQYRCRLRKALANIYHISLTTDIWTSKRTSFICLTGHMFNNKFQLIPLVLGFRRISGPHLGDNIRTYIRYELGQLAIENKIDAITSDNGSDVKKTTSSIEFGHGFWCFAHCLNLVVRNGLGIWTKTQTKK